MRTLFILVFACLAFGQFNTNNLLWKATTPTGQYLKDDGTTGPGGSGGVTPTGTGWVYVLNGVQATAASTPTALQVGADAAGLAVACTTGLGTRLKNDTIGMKLDTAGLGTALAGKSATSHTHTTIDTCNIRALKTPKADSINVLAGLRCKKLVVGSGTLMLDSIEIKDGTTDTLIIGAFGKKWKFLPIASQ
jgi:hypothetical protein